MFRLARAPIVSKATRVLTLSSVPWASHCLGGSRGPKCQGLLECMTCQECIEFPQGVSIAESVSRVSSVGAASPTAGISTWMGGDFNILKLA